MTSPSHDHDHDQRPPADPQLAIDFLNERLGRLTQELFDAFIERRKLQASVDERDELIEALQASSS